VFLSRNSGKKKSGINIPFFRPCRSHVDHRPVS
jgi:hypothetical protein